MGWMIPAGIGLIMGGSYLKGTAEEQQAKATADILEYNRDVEYENAKAAMYAGESEADKLDRQKRMILGKQTAAYGAKGWNLEGTPLSIMADTVSQYELDKATTMWNARTKSNAYISQGNIYEASADAQRQKARTAVARSLLSGAVSAAGMYLGSPYANNNTSPWTQWIGG